MSGVLCLWYILLHYLVQITFSSHLELCLLVPDCPGISRDDGGGGEVGHLSLGGLRPLALLLACLHTALCLWLLLGGASTSTSSAPSLRIRFNLRLGREVPFELRIEVRKIYAGLSRAILAQVMRFDHL